MRLDSGNKSEILPVTITQQALAVFSLFTFTTLHFWVYLSWELWHNFKYKNKKVPLWFSLRAQFSGILNANLPLHHRHLVRNCLRQINLNTILKGQTSEEGRQHAVMQGTFEFWVTSDAIIVGLHFKPLNHQSSTSATERQQHRQSVFMVYFVLTWTNRSRLEGL